MRLREQRQQRRDAAKEGEDGVPSEPGRANAEQHFGRRTTHDADTRHEQTEGRWPRTAIDTPPTMPAARNDDDPPEWRTPTGPQGGTTAGLRERTEVCPCNGIHDRIRDAEREPSPLCIRFRQKRASAIGLRRNRVQRRTRLPDTT